MLIYLNVAKFVLNSLIFMNNLHCILSLQRFKHVRCLNGFGFVCFVMNSETQVFKVQFINQN